MYGLDLKRRWCPLVTGHSSPAVPNSLSLIGLDIGKDDLDPDPVTPNPVPSGSTASSLAYLVQSHEWPRLFRDMANYVKLCQIDKRWFNSLLALLPDALHACRLASCPLDVQQTIVILSYMHEKRIKLAWTQTTPKLFAQFVKALQSGEPSDDSLSKLTSLPSCSNPYFDRTYPEGESFEPCASVLVPYLRQHAVPPSIGRPRTSPETMMIWARFSLRFIDSQRGYA